MDDPWTCIAWIENLPDRQIAKCPLNQEPRASSNKCFLLSVCTWTHQAVPHLPAWMKRIFCFQGGRAYAEKVDHFQDISRMAGTTISRSNFQSNLALILHVNEMKFNHVHSNYIFLPVLVVTKIDIMQNVSTCSSGSILLMENLLILHN